MTNNVYTIEDWNNEATGELNPKLFQEVDHEIYSQMYEVLPPYPLKEEVEKKLENQLGIKLVQTFCMGEAYTTDDEDNYLYKSFAKTKDNTCIYLGLQRAEYDY